MKLFDKIKKALEDHQLLRNSDRELIWYIWKQEGLTEDFKIDYRNFLKATSPESIRRGRQKCQELYPWLQADENVKKVRRDKESNYPSWVFREGQADLFN